MRITLLSRILLCGVATGCFLPAGASVATAKAQLEPAAEVQASDAQGVSKVQANSTQAQPALDTIVVTARRREENLRDVPVSITAIGGDLITEQKITQVVDLGQRVPNLTVSTGSNLPFALIRGFGSGNNISFDQAVGKFIDNVSYGRDQDIRLPIFDVERVEVLKGPQVLLYGNSATAGALNITTRKPTPDLAADFSAGYEFNFDEVTAQGGVTVPVSDMAGLRVAGIYQYRDKGLTYNVATGRDEPQGRAYGLRATFELDPTSDLTVRLKAEYDRVRDEGTAAETLSQPVFAHPTFGVVLNFDDVQFDDRNAISSAGAPFFQDTFAEVRNQTYQGDLIYELGEGTINSTTAYRDLKFAQSLPSGVPAPVLNAFLAYRYKQFSQELRYTGTFGAFDVTAGGYYQHDNFDVYSAIDFNTNGFGGLSTFSLNGRLNKESDSYSIYADVIYNLTDALSIELGGRYSWIERSADQALVPGDLVTGKTFDSQSAIYQPNRALDGFFAALNNGIPPHVFDDLQYKDGFFQPQAVIKYEITPDANIFGKYVRGKKAGGFDYFYTGTPGSVTPEGAQFESEAASSFEAGFKGLFLDGTLDLSLVAFRTTFTDLQASQFQFVSFVVANVGKARTQGVELDLTWAAAEGLTLSGSLGYLDSKYLDYPGQPCTVEQKLVFAGNPNLCTQDLSGERTQFSSEWTGVLSANYVTPISRSYDLGLGVDLFARSGYNATTNNDQLGRQDGYAKIDARIDLTETDGGLKFTVYGKNLTDKRTLEFGSTAPFSGDAFSGFYSRGREIGARIGFEF